MKKIYILLGAALLALTACEKTEIAGPDCLRKDGDKDSAAPHP